MKYLKLFEQIDDDQYQKVEYGVFLDLLVSEKENLTEKEVEKIKSVIPDGYLDNCVVGKYVIVIMPTKSNNYANIWKIVDRWFLVEYVKDNPNRFEYYKCDEIEGLLNLLKVLPF